MLVELLVSVAIVLALLGIVFELVDPSAGTLAVQSLTADVHQRQRAALGELHRQLLLAGSGPHPGTNGVVAHLRPAVAPSLRGAATNLSPGADRVSVLYAPSGEAGARLANDIAGSSATVGLLPGAACVLPCGLSERGGGLVLVFDATGRSDLYRITDLTGATASLQHVRGGAPAYGAGSFIAPVLVRGFYLDHGAEQLRVHNGAGSDLPFVDGVVELPSATSASRNPRCHRRDRWRRRRRAWSPRPSRRRRQPGPTSSIRRSSATTCRVAGKRRSTSICFESGACGSI